MISDLFSFFLYTLYNENYTLLLLISAFYGDYYTCDLFVLQLNKKRIGKNVPAVYGPSLEILNVVTRWAGNVVRTLEGGGC